MENFIRKVGVRMNKRIFVATIKDNKYITNVTKNIFNKQNLTREDMLYLFDYLAYNIIFDVTDGKELECRDKIKEIIDLRYRDVVNKRLKI